MNADEIARGLNPLNPDGVALSAGKIMLERLDTLKNSGRNFAFETTCAGRMYKRFLQECKQAGYSFSLVYLWLDSPEMAINRVAKRVRNGGHNIPENVIRRRYSAGLDNMLKICLPLADDAIILDNSQSSGNILYKQLIAAKLPSGKFQVNNHEIWSAIENYESNNSNT